MIETMRAANGAGLAANQVGETVRVAVVEVRPGNPRYPYKPPVPLTVIVNPVIEPLDDEVVQINEGCLSVPNLRGEVPRHVSVRVRYLDRDGAEHEEVQARSDRRDLPARARPPRRRPVRGPGDGPGARSRPGPSSSASTATSSWSARASSWSGWARDGLLVRAGVAGRAAPGAGRADRGRGRPDHGVRSGEQPPPRDARRLDGPDAAGPRQRPLARVPARAARPHAARQRHVLDVARADVRLAARLDPDELPRARARDLRRDGAGGDHDRRRVPLPPPRARRHAVRRPERDGPRADGGGRGGRDPDHADRLLLPARRNRRAGRGRAAALLRWQRRRLGGACRRSRRERVGADRRGDPQHARGGPGVGSDGGWAGRASASGRCTRTSRSSPPRTRHASTPTGARRPHCSPRRAPSRPASPPCTRRTWTTATSVCSATRARAAASARRRSATWPTGSAGCVRWSTRAPRSRSAATRTR